MGNQPKQQNLALHYFSIFTAVTALSLLVTGAHVTSTDAGDSIPQWPLWTGIIGSEGTHRIIAGLTGLLITTLTIWLWRVDDRRLVRRLATAALLGVILQASIGGLRVKVISDETLQSFMLATTGAPHAGFLSTTIAIIHATLAQIVFCLTVALAVTTTPAWKRHEAMKTHLTDGDTLHWTRRITHVLLAVVFIQLLLGALVRHTESGLILPRFPSFVPEPYDANAPFPISKTIWKLKVGLHTAHRLGGIIVASLIVSIAWRMTRSHRNQKPLFLTAWLMTVLTAAQLFLGALIILSELHVTVTILHVAIGAALLGSGTIMSLWSEHLLSKITTAHSGIEWTTEPQTGATS